MSHADATAPMVATPRCGAMVAALCVVLLCTLLALPAVALADDAQTDQAQADDAQAAQAQGAQADDAREFLTLTCIACESESREEDPAGRFLLLCDDGTGIFSPNEESYRIDYWETEVGRFRATTTTGKTIEGTIDEDYVLSIEWEGDWKTYRLQFTDTGAPARIQDLSPDTWYQGLPNVFDEAGLLSNEQLSELETRAADLSERYGCDVRLVVLGDMADYTDWYDINRLAEELTYGYDLGHGEDGDLILLLMSMAGRDFSLTSFGPRGRDLFFDQDAREMTVYEFRESFSNNDWYQGFNDYLDSVEKVFVRREQGIPLARAEAPVHVAVSAAFCLAIGFGLAYLASSLVRDRNRNVRAAGSARQYVAPGGSQVTFRRDNFVRTTTARAYVPLKSDDRPSRSGTRSHNSRGGFGHTSGKF